MPNASRRKSASAIIPFLFLLLMSNILALNTYSSRSKLGSSRTYDFIIDNIKLSHSDGARTDPSLSSALNSTFAQIAHCTRSPPINHSDGSAAKLLRGSASRDPFLRVLISKPNDLRITLLLFAVFDSLPHLDREDLPTQFDFILSARGSLAYPLQ